jgi:hypothetical protein
MTFNKKRAVLAVFFAGLLAGPAIYQRVAKTESTVATDRLEQKHQAILDRYGMRLEESAKQAGLDFHHTPPALDPKLEHIGPQVASMGAAVSVVDFDRDGWSDVYVTNSSPGSLNRLYRNQQDGTFRDVAQELGVADLNQPGTGACMGTVWADYDNDGYEDLFVYKWGRPELFHNDAGKGFTRVTEQAGLPEWVNAGTATWFDYDRDGLVDLFIAGYWPDEVRLESLSHTRIMPESFEYANNGGRKWLLHNQGNGAFEDVTKEVGINSSRWTLACVAADFNGDHEPDLYLSNDYGLAELYLNEVDGNRRRFREVAKETGIGVAPKSGMNAALGDVLNNGSLAVYQSNISEEGVLIQGNNLWMPLEPGSLQFQNMASVMGVELGGWSFGAQFGDLNNDGALDLYLTNGYVSGKPGTTYWYDFAQITGGHSTIISDAKNWPAMGGRSLAGFQTKRVWLNNGSGGFTEVAQGVGATDTFDGRAVALADLQNRGALDVLVANQCGPLLLYRNQVDPKRHWIALELEGIKSNRSAIGAEVRVYWGGQQQLQVLTSASGYSAQNQRRLHFGLGERGTVDKVEIRWPSGREQVLEAPAADTIHRIQEAS